VTERLIFWAQALDNASPDHIDIGGTRLSPDDAVRRQEAVSLVSNVIKAGTRIFEARGVQLTEDGRHFVVEVPSVERDRAGRVAPIICYGAYDASIGDALVSSVVDGFNDFAKRIDRNILPAHSELARKSFIELKKKYSTRRIIRAIAAVAAASALLALVYWLASKGSLTR
jgi:hypothetical protein